MNKFQDRVQSVLLNYGKSVDHNAMIFMDQHFKCSIWFRDFEMIEFIGSIKTSIRCTICCTQIRIGEITFVRE